MFKSIKTRITVTISVVLLIVFSLQMIANFLLAEKYYVYQKKKLITSVYQQLRETASTSDSDIIDIIHRIEFDNNLEFILADKNMNLLYTNKINPPKPGSKDPASPATDFDFRKYPLSDYQNSKPTIVKSINTEFDNIHLLGTIEQGGTTYYLAIRMSVKSISEDRISTNLFILYISSFALIFGVLLLYLFAKQIAKPIEDINQVTIHVSNLDFSKRAPDYKRNDEIGSLANNINIMSNKLEQNIMRLKEANIKLEQDNEYMNKVDEMRKEFIANVSHELKTPLSILSGYAEMLSNDIPGLDKTFYYDTILDETRKMDVMIRNLLNVSHMENRLANFESREINLADLTRYIFQKNTVLFEKKGICAEFQSETCPNIFGDPMYLEEAINNYLSNAIRHTETGNKLLVRVYTAEKEVFVSVFNEGITINESQLDKIWSSFYRTDKSRTRTSDNNIGLGLYIVQTIVNAHHGNYGVKNRENGVEFWLSMKPVPENKA
jgi:Signal transduction histidine kinase